MTENIYWILKADIGEGNLKDLKKVTEEFCHNTADEPGTIAYEWSMSSDRKILHIYERYVDCDAVLAHLGNIGAILPKLLELVSITRIEFYGRPNSAIEEAFKELPVDYMENYAGFHK